MMAISLQDLRDHPNALAAHYRRFSVDERPGAGRLLLTGHSHQAWPDRAREGLLAAYDDSARHLDEKWDLAFAKGQRVKEAFARLLGDSEGTCALGSSTHDLLLRFLSALPLAERPRLLTTDGEFHSIRRQLDRLAEAGLEIVKIGAEDPETLAERLAAAVDHRTAAVLVSAVLFSSGRVVHGLGQVMEAADRHGAEVLVDAYHALCALPFSLRREGIQRAFVVGGGYKYCQLGEGNCFLRVPEGCQLRPVITGWFAEFAELAKLREDEPRSAPGHVAYGRGAERFAGSTYDPTSHYRGAAVLDFFEEMGLTPEFLREINQHQVGLLAAEFDALDLDPRLLRRDVDLPLRESGAFLVLHTPHAATLCNEMRRRGVTTDYRGTHFRLGPAPYLCDEQLRDGIRCLGESVQTL